MRISPGGNPCDHLRRIVDRIQRAPRLRVDDFRKKFVRKSLFQVRQRLHAGKLEPKPALHRGETVLFSQPRVPFAKRPNPARDRAVHAIESAVPEIMLVEDVVEIRMDSSVILRGEKRKARCPRDRAEFRLVFQAVDLLAIGGYGFQGDFLTRTQPVEGIFFKSKRSRPPCIPPRRWAMPRSMRSVSIFRYWNIGLSLSRISSSSPP